MLSQKDDLIQRQTVLSQESDHRLLNGLQMIVSLLSLSGINECRGCLAIGYRGRSNYHDWAYALDDLSLCDILSPSSQRNIKLRELCALLGMRYDGLEDNEGRKALLARPRSRNRRLLQKRRGEYFSDLAASGAASRSPLSAWISA